MKALPLVIGFALTMPRLGLALEYLKNIGSCDITPQQAQWVGRVGMQPLPVGSSSFMQFDRQEAIDSLLKSGIQIRADAANEYAKMKVINGIRETAWNTLEGLEIPGVSLGAKAVGALDSKMGEVMLDKFFRATLTPENAVSLRQAVGKLEGRPERVEAIKRTLRDLLRNEENFLALNPDHRDVFLLQAARMAAEVLADHGERLDALEAHSQDDRKRDMESAFEIQQALGQMVNGIQRVHETTSQLSDSLDKSLVHRPENN